MDAERALSLGLGLRTAHWRILVRVGWVLFVTFHIARAAGWLVVFGFAVPFASATDMEDLKRAATITARLQIQDELRAQEYVYCRETDYGRRQVYFRRIEDLREELREVAKIEWPETKCAQEPPKQQTAGSP